jgi:hypothetical protein
MERLPRVRRTDQRQQLTIKIKTGPQHADRLKGFVSTTGVHRSKPGADGGGQTPVWIGYGHPPPMDAFDEAVAHHLDEYWIRFERAGHDLTLRFDHPRRAFVLRSANALLRYSAAGLLTL